MSPKRATTHITGGQLRGRRLVVPGGVRPSSARLREALFAIWADRLDGAQLLDLCAGSGAVSLEAISRGALAVTAVESAPGVLATLRRQCDELAPGAVRVRRGELPGLLDRLAAEGERFELVFADPPYRWHDYAPLLEAVEPLLAVGGELVVEHSVRRPLPLTAGRLVRTDQRRYGESALSFYRAPR